LVSLLPRTGQDAACPRGWTAAALRRSAAAPQIAGNDGGTILGGNTLCRQVFFASGEVEL
jgi:hypothetical protein